jgi:hypothetical protein
LKKKFSHQRATSADLLFHEKKMLFTEDESLPCTINIPLQNFGTAGITNKSQSLLPAAALYSYHAQLAPFSPNVWWRLELGKEPDEKKQS